MRPLRVGHDLDGVHYNFIDACRTWFHLAHAVPLDRMPEPTQWNIWECWDMTQADWTAKVNAGVDAGYIFAIGHGEIGSRQLNYVLRARGHTQHILTARDGFGSRDEHGHSTHGRINTFAWLERVGFHYDTIDITNDKTSRPVDVMIEDNLDNYDRLDAAGVHAVLIDRPWNRDNRERRRVYTLDGFLQVVDELANAPELAAV